MLALIAVADVAGGMAQKQVVDWLQAEGLWAAMSNQEIAFTTSAAPSDADVAHASWGIEGAWCLGWALGLLDELGPRTQACTPSELTEQIPGIGQPTGKFVEYATLRPNPEILNACDLVLRAHWAMRDAYLNQGTPAEGIDADIVPEWHKALNWLTRYCDEDDWDEVTTDT